MNIYLVDSEKLYFPDPRRFNTSEDLPIAVGGDLSPERLLLAYSMGIFPWYNQEDPLIMWWCPDPRFVLFPNELKVSKSMRKIMNREIFTFTENKAFREVMIACQQIKRNGQDGTWINDDLIDSFVELHQKGKAKSVEVWQNENLVGGFYGVEEGDVFCGESMFSKVSNASKAGFIYWVSQHKDQYKLIDCQIPTQHLESLGARSIPKSDYLSYLNNEK